MMMRGGSIGAVEADIRVNTHQRALQQVAHRDSPVTLLPQAAYQNTAENCETDILAFLHVLARAQPIIRMAGFGYLIR